MSKIESLTPEQEQMLNKHRNEYLQWGLSCEPMNQDAVKATIGEMYRRIGKNVPSFWFCQSPAQMLIVISILKSKLLGANLWDNLRDNLRDNLGANLRDNLGDNLRVNLWDNLRANLGVNLRDNLGANLRANLEVNLRDNLEVNLRDNLEDNLRDDLRVNLWANLWANLGNNLRSNLKANLRANFWDDLWDDLRDNLGNNLWDSDFWGQMDMFWIAYYRYPEQYLHVDYGEFSKVLQLWDTLGKSCGWWYPYENICFVSDRPEQIHRKGVQLHNDSGPAVLYRDGYALWCLNGVDVGESIVTTPADQLDANLILTTKNAEVRREIVRKIGIERVCNKLNAKVIDTQGDYSLLLLDLRDGRKRPYLKMLNPSIGTYHIEGVPPECDTVEKAITWRNQTSEKPVILT